MSQVDWQRLPTSWDRMIAIDPGLSGTGIAIFERDAARRMQPISTSVFLPRKTAGFIEKSYEIVAHLYHTFIEKDEGGYHAVHGIIEYPAYQEGAVRQMGWKTGDLQKLCFLVGALSMGILWTRLTLVMPRDWKGQLPKGVVESRLTKLLGEKECQRLGVKTHAWDALGLGLHVLGRFGPAPNSPLPSESLEEKITIRRRQR